MGLKKLNSEYNSRYKTFTVHRPVLTRAKSTSHPTDIAPEALESSRRAGLLSNQFSNVSEPALQRKRIVPYKHNHNILSTSTVKELNDRDWLEAVGNGDDEQTSAGVKTTGANRTENTEYSSSFAKLKLKEDSPIILASKTRKKQKTPPKTSAKQHKTQSEKSPDRMPPAGIPTYISDPYDKRQLRACDDLVYPVTSKDEHRNSETEYSKRYQSSDPENRDRKPLPISSDIDMATYKKVLLTRNDAYGLSKRPNTSPAISKSSAPLTLKAKQGRTQRGRRHSLDSKNTDSYTSERRGKEFNTRPYTVSKNKQAKENKMSKLRKNDRALSQRSLDEDSLSSIRSANHLEAQRSLPKQTRKEETKQNASDRKMKDFYAESVSSRNSQSSSTVPRDNKEKLIPAVIRPKNPKNVSAWHDLEQESASSAQSPRNGKVSTRKRSEKLSSHKSSQSKKHYRSDKQESRGSRRISRDTNGSNGSILERGRSPTPEMRTAGQSRRHHLDITTGSNNPLATGPDPRVKMYERTAYDPSRYSDIGDSLTSSHSFATWSDRGLK